MVTYDFISLAARGQCPSLIWQHLLCDSVEYGVVVVKFEVDYVWVFSYFVGS
jgi:hypothetical protein